MILRETEREPAPVLTFREGPVPVLRAPVAARDVVTSLPMRTGPGGGASGGGGTAPTVSLALDYEPARAALPVPLLVGLAVAMLLALRRR